MIPETFHAMSSSLNIDIGQFKNASVVSTHAEVIKNSHSRLSHRVFAIAVFLVVATSIYDAFLVYRFRVAIDEQNPFCDWLISLEPEYVSVFLLSKGLGTMGVASILVGLFKYWRRVAFPVAVSLVFFQAGLMSYLHGTDGRRKSPQQFAMATIQSQQSPVDPIPTPIAKRGKRDWRGRKAAQLERRRGKAQRWNRQSQESGLEFQKLFRRKTSRFERLGQGPVATVLAH